MYNDNYGFFGNSSDKDQVHIPDLILSFLWTFIMAALLVVVHVIPGDSINKFSFTVASICTVAI